MRSRSQARCPAPTTSKCRRSTRRCTSPATTTRATNAHDVKQMHASANPSVCVPAVGRREQSSIDPRQHQRAKHGQHRTHPDHKRNARQRSAGPQDGVAAIQPHRVEQQQIGHRIADAAQVERQGDVQRECRIGGPKRQRPGNQDAAEVQCEQHGAGGEQRQVQQPAGLLRGRTLHRIGIARPEIQFRRRWHHDRGRGGCLSGKAAPDATGGSGCTASGHGNSCNTCATPPGLHGMAIAGMLFANLAQKGSLATDD